MKLPWIGSGALWHQVWAQIHTDSLATALLICVATPSCSDAPPPASPRSDVREVYVHRADDKPDFIKLERDGDPNAALAAAYVHGASAKTSRALARRVTEHLTRQGFVASVTPTDAAILVGISVDGALQGKNPVTALTAALDAGFRQPLPKPEDENTALSSPCGSGTILASAVAPGHQNVVLAAVGTAARLTALQAAYEKQTWPSGDAPALGLPQTDEFVASSAPEPASLVVAVRTPLRQRVLPAARTVGAPDSLLGLLSRSHPGRWLVRSSHASFVPGGGCLSVHLEAQQSVAPLYAARAAKAIARELEWTLAESVADEDPRFNVLEAPSAEDAALRAAWEAATARSHSANAKASTFMHYRGNATNDAWQNLVQADTPKLALPLTAIDERGQGRVWAALTHGCPLLQEDNTSAGHTAAGLLAAAGLSGERTSVFSSWPHLGLVAWQPTPTSGAEDQAAESIARGLLRTLNDPGLVNQVLPGPELLLDSPTWTLALTLATSGHPSWLSQRSTPQSRALLDAGSLEAAVRRFAAGPLQLSVLTNHGQTQAERLSARLGHLLSGLYDPGASCSEPATAQNPAPAGEYEVGSEGATDAVALYVVNRRFAHAVRQLATALNQPGGWLRRALAPLGAQVTAIGLGSPDTLAGLGFTVSAESPEVVDAALAQLRVLIADLGRAPLASLTAQASQSKTRDPAARLADLLDQTKSSEAPAATAAPGVDILIREALTERRLFVVRPLRTPPPPIRARPK